MLNTLKIYWTLDVLNPTVTVGGNLNQRLTLFVILSQIFLDVLNMNLFWTEWEHCTNYQSIALIKQNKFETLLQAVLLKFRFVLPKPTLIRYLCLCRYISIDFLCFLKCSYMLYFKDHFEVRIYGVGLVHYSEQHN